MGTKILSLSKNEDFKKILNGKKISNYYSTIFFKTISPSHKNVLNLSIIAKRKLGKAVQRNKIKRRLKNIMNGIIKEKQVSFDYCYLFLAKKNVFDDDFKKIKGILAADLKKIKT